MRGNFLPTPPPPERVSDTEEEKFKSIRTLHVAFRAYPQLSFQDNASDASSRAFVIQKYAKLSFVRFTFRQDLKIKAIKLKRLLKKYYLQSFIYFLQIGKRKVLPTI